MRLPILLLVAGVPLLAEPQATLAQAGYPWCSIRSSGAGPGGRKVCVYESWDQCMAMVQSIGVAFRAPCLVPMRRACTTGGQARGGTNANSARGRSGSLPAVPPVPRACPVILGSLHRGRIPVACFPWMAAHFCLVQFAHHPPHVSRCGLTPWRSRSRQKVGLHVERAEPVHVAGDRCGRDARRSRA
jgi:hypothetical protein